MKDPEDRNEENMGDKIVTENLNLWYGTSHALKNVSLSFPEKNISALIGPSGCGKSTYLKTLNRMNDLVEGCRIEGKVLFSGIDIYKDIDVNLLRKRVGMVFQKPNPFPMSIYDNIAYGPRIHGIRSKVRLDEIVERSLTQAAIWDECKDRLKKVRWGSAAGSSRGSVLPGRWQLSRKCFSWMSRPLRWILYPLPELRI